MRLLLICLFAVLLVLPVTAAGDRPDSSALGMHPLHPEPYHREVSQTVSKLLTKKHYIKKRLNDSLSVEAFDRFIESIDGNRMFLLQSDVDSFEKHRYLFDNYIGSGQIGPAFDIFNQYQKRYAERLNFIFKRIEEPFDFSEDETVELDRSAEPWAQTPEELDEVWRKRLEHEALSLKLAGKADSSIVSTLSKRYERWERNALQTQSEDVFQVVMNALAESFDPHTSYFSPKNFDDFKIRMSQSLEGIGARLAPENEYTRVVEIVPGGPADKGKLLQTNDKIIGVGQGSDGEIVDVIGWRIDDVVQLIRGKKETIVRLQVLAADAAAGAAADTLAIVRDKIKLEDQSATSDTLDFMYEGVQHRVGVIEIPSFYADFEGMRKGERNYKSTTRDVQRIIGELKGAKVDGIIIDLRRNGGGFLNEAVDLTGLFIESGPVVQVRHTSGKVDVERDHSRRKVYDGPLAVLVDRLSASASEIFAAAIQDYNRGIIIGSQSFGKGTVQNAIDLNRFIHVGDSKMGQLKLTVAKFYRIDGRSTQHVGVIPDVSFPSRYNLMDIGESSTKNALIWDEIDGVSHDNFGDFSDLLPEIKRRQQLRLAVNKDYSKLLDDLEEFEKKRDRTSISLKESVRRAEQKRDQAKAGPQNDPEEEIDPEEQDADLLLQESARVLVDYTKLSETHHTQIEKTEVEKKRER